MKIYRSISRFGLPVALLAMAGCSRGTNAAGAGPQAMPVQTETIQLKPVPEFTEYLATVRAQGSAVLQPQVEGFITRIYVKPGARVTEGQRLIQIDPLKQEAAVTSAESTRRSRIAQLELARTNLERIKKLHAEGVTSRQELDNAQSTYEAARAEVDALQASVAEQRQQLRYYTVSAPSDGVIGDIPVRVGDRVNSNTQMTTIDSGQGLELYISIPAEKATDTRLGATVQILPEEGQPLTTKVSFVAPRVDPANQLLLIKAALPGDKRFRNEQTVHARVVWSEKPGITIPLSAVARIAGQQFAYVAQDEQGKTVAKQRRLEVGDLVGNDYIVRGGLNAGDKLITSGVQFLADGAPVAPLPPQPAGHPSQPQEKKQ